VRERTRWERTTMRDGFGTEPTRRLERPGAMHPPARSLAAALVLTLGLGGCNLLSGTLPAPGTANVTGLAHAGPVCPVVQPGQVGCEDRPVAGAVLDVQKQDGARVAETRTGADGRFALSLPEGSYTLVPQPVQGLLGTGRPVPFAVAGTAPVTLDVSYDTGIR
jgi:hypothetical protein